MRRISLCLNTKLTDLCRHSIKLEELSQKVETHLPQALRGQCQVGSFNKGCLILITHNAGWASQLRYELPMLRDHLRSAGIYQLSSIKITVSTEQHIQLQKQLKIQKISSKARQCITTSAENCQFKPLRDALYHLAKEDID